MKTDLLLNTAISKLSIPETVEHLLALGFLPMEDSISPSFYKHLPNNICIEAYIIQDDLLIKIHVINEFEGPYDKNEDICIVLNTSDIHTALLFADRIKFVTINNQII